MFCCQLIAKKQELGESPIPAHRGGLGSRPIFDSEEEEEDGGGGDDGGHVSFRASVMMGCYASPVLGSSEGVFYPVSIESFVIGMGLLSHHRGRDANLVAAPVQPLLQPVRIIGVVEDQGRQKPLLKMN